MGEKDPLDKQVENVNETPLRRAGREPQRPDPVRKGEFHTSQQTAASLLPTRSERLQILGPRDYGRQ